jgi:hypothetical protein
MSSTKSGPAQRRILIQEYLSRLPLDKKMQYGHQFDPLIAKALYADYEVYNTYVGWNMFSWSGFFIDTFSAVIS